MGWGMPAPGKVLSDPPVYALWELSTRAQYRAYLVTCHLNNFSKELEKLEHIFNNPAWRFFRRRKEKQPDGNVLTVSGSLTRGRERPPTVFPSLNSECNHYWTFTLSATLPDLVARYAEGTTAWRPRHRAAHPRTCFASAPDADL